ncbi:MAG: molybdenum cofactor biosynthesis protein MoaE [Acidimicrobiales bacterium]
MAACSPRLPTSTVARADRRGPARRRRGRLDGPPGLRCRRGVQRHGPRPRTGTAGVERLEYEAYEEQVVPRLAEIAAEMRRSWPGLGRIALLHRVGVVPVGDSSVVVAVSSPHRPAAFEAARFGIDTLKATVPIWKRETWADGESWGLDAQHITEVGGDR